MSSRKSFLLAPMAVILAAIPIVPGTAATAPSSKPPANRNWESTVTETPWGGFLMGNPKAKVRLVEIASLSCPHCKAFEEEGGPPLVSGYVKSGKVSYEFRPYLIHGMIDMAANLTVRCAGPKNFFPLARSLYRNQPAMLAKVETAPRSKVEAIRTLPKTRAFVEMASLLGLQDWAAAHGFARAKSNACLSNAEMIDREIASSQKVSDQYPDFKGTPAFAINGRFLSGVVTWERLEPELKEALKSAEASPAPASDGKRPAARL